jgi:hypothetical protein
MDAMQRLWLTALLPLFLAATPADLKSGKFGTVLSVKAVVQVSSTCSYDTPETHLNLVRGERVPCAFHTGKEQQPWVILKLERPATIKAIEIINRQDGSGFRQASLAAFLSEDGKTWTEVWNAGGKAEDTWIFPVNGGSGQKAAWVKLALTQEQPEFFHLSRVTVYGQ